MDWLPSDDTPIVEAAVNYAGRGWPVVPVYGVRPDGSCSCGVRTCAAIGKHPIGARWQERAVLRAGDALEAWRANPGANIGLVLGARLVVVDVDGPGGDDLVARLPPTLSSTSGRGAHYVFRYAPGQSAERVTNRRVCADVDIKTRSGQIVIAPSLHRSGVRYRWANRVDIAPLPDWLYDQIRVHEPERRTLAPFRPTSYAEAAVEGACRRITGLASGERNSGLLVQARNALAHVVGAGAGVGGAVLRLEAAGCATGLPTAEVRRVVQNALKYAEKDPRAPAHVVESSPGSASGSGILPPYTPESGTYARADESPKYQEISTDIEYDSRGKFVKHFANYVAALAGLAATKPEWAMKYNVMTLCYEVGGTPLSEELASRIQAFFCREFGVDPGETSVWRAIVAIASQHKYHPVADYLRGLQWDGAPRLDAVASHILGIESPSDGIVAMLRKFFISCVARAVCPGCKVDTVLVLYSPEQGLYKSQFFRVLASPWFGEGLIDVRNKDAVMMMYRSWIHEIPEIDEITNGQNTSALKGFLSQATDTIRLPYGRTVTTGARHSILVGTSNVQEFLVDSTGERRFWPIPVPKRINVERLEAWRDQLWGEAHQAYHAGEPWHLDDSLLIEERSPFVVLDPWTEQIRSQTGSLVETTMGHVLGVILGIEPALQDTRAVRRAAAALRGLGFVSVARNGARTWRRARLQHTSSTPTCSDR